MYQTGQESDKMHQCLVVVLERVAATSEMNGKPSNSIKVMRKFPNPGQAKAKNEIASTSYLLRSTAN